MIARRFFATEAVGGLDFQKKSKRPMGSPSVGGHLAASSEKTIEEAALRELEGLCLDREAAHFKEQLALKYAEMVYFGQWFTPLREALDCFVNKLMEPVSGSVRLKLYKGNVIIAGRSSGNTLYRPDLASFTMGATYDQRDAEGFINIFGLPLKVKALTQK